MSTCLGLCYGSRFYALSENDECPCAHVRPTRGSYAPCGHVRMASDRARGHCDLSCIYSLSEHIMFTCSHAHMSTCLGLCYGSHFYALSENIMPTCPHAHMVTCSTRLINSSCVVHQLTPSSNSVLMRYTTVPRVQFHQRAFTYLSKVPSSNLSPTQKRA